MLYYTRHSAITGELNGDGLVNGSALTLSGNQHFLTFHRRLKEQLRYELPPVKGTMRSKVRPIIRFPFELIEELNPSEIKEVPCHYVSVLSWLLKKEFFQTTSLDEGTPQVYKKIKGELTAKMSILLTSGQWIDEPSDLFEDNLNALLKNIDLGRCSFLKYRSHQSEEAWERINRFRKVAFKERKREIALGKEKYLIQQGILESPIEKPTAPEVAVPAGKKSFAAWLEDNPE